MNIYFLDMVSEAQPSSAELSSRLQVKFRSDPHPSRSGTWAEGATAVCGMLFSQWMAGAPWEAET